MTTAPRRLLAVLIAGVTLAAGAVVAPLAASASPASVSPASVARSATNLVDFGCATGTIHCFGQLRRSASDGDVTGLTPTQLRKAYRLDGLKAHGRTVAIVDAYDDPNVEGDLAYYRKHFGLPACTTKNGCFRKVNQNGTKSPLPKGDYGWGEEITLDVEAVSAVCPDCHILLVEANSADTGPLMKAVDTAVRLGAVAVSNSYGGDEDNTIRKDDKYLKHPGVAITASSGDDGYGVSWPASSPYVTAVGGTTLTPAHNARGWTETVWNGAGSGCSKYEPKPSWQKDKGCSRRTVADVAAVADPDTGLAVYGTYNDCLISLLCNLPVAGAGGEGLDGWAQVGGTSLSSPIIAAVYALAGRKVTYGSRPYAHRSSLFDVTSGNNGSCGGSYLCTGKKGYDGPSGLGSPNGVGAF